jgi:hypothetical protein
MIKRSYEDLNRFVFAAQRWLEKDKANEFTKLAYAIAKVTARCQKHLQRYQAKVQDFRIDVCLTSDKEGEKGKILKDAQGDLEFTPAKLKECNRKQQELFESEVEIEPHFATEVPKNLTEIEREVFEGLVIAVQAEAKAGAATGD